MDAPGLKLSTDTFAKPKVQPLKLLSGIAKIIVDVATLGWHNLPSDVLDTINEIKLDAKPEMAGWKLVSRSLANAVLSLIVDSNGIFSKDAIETDPLDETLNKFLEDRKYFLKSDFFKKPRNFTLINDIKPTLNEYFSLFGFEEHEADNLLDRLNSYFVYSLVNEWRKNANYYAVLKDIIETPFSEAEKKETEWQVYSNYLQTQIDKPVFSETFCLSQIYIPLRAYYKVKPKKDSKDDISAIEKMGESDDKVKRIVVELDHHLTEWLAKQDKQDSIRIIRGGPGYGKSSFLKMFAAKLAASGKRVIFIPLHRFDIEGKLDQAIKNFLRFDKYLTYDPINDDTEPMILLFDGLDELSMQGKMLYDIAQSFLRELERSVANHNNRNLRLQAIVTGRDVIVQQNESDFRNDGQILRLLPYYLTNEDKKNLFDEKDLLKNDQRIDWWKKYGKLTGLNYSGLPVELKTIEIDELTAQPLLNFLIALSYQRKKVDFSKKPNLNEIYADLLSAVYERTYSEGKKLKTISEMEYEHFCIILEEIALSTWHNQGRTTTVNEITKHFENSGLTELLKRFIEDAEKGIVSLLAAFYFRQARQAADGMRTFEFTHKSFGEYLTAKKIVRQIKVISEQLEENVKDLYGRKGWGSERCLIEWVKVFGRKQPDHDLVKFIRNEFLLNDQISYECFKSHELQKTIIKLINHFLRLGMPIERLHPRPETFKEENEVAINAEAALLMMHGIIARITNQVADIQWPKNTSFGEWIGRLIGQREGLDSYIPKFCNHLNLNSSIIVLKNFYLGVFDYTQFGNAELFYSSFEDADLCDTNLEKANLQFANLNTANLQRANLSDACLDAAILSAAQLQKADLRGASLLIANLKRANLQRANLQGADLQGANLQGADLQGANLQEANLQEADLQGTKFDEGVLEDLKRNGQI